MSGLGVQVLAPIKALFWAVLLVCSLFASLPFPHRNAIKACTQKFLRSYSIQSHYFLYFKAHKNISSSQRKLLNCTIWLMALAEESIPACTQPQAHTQGPVIWRGTNCFPSSGLLSERVQGMQYISNSTWLTQMANIQKNQWNSYWRMYSVFLPLSHCPS